MYACVVLEDMYESKIIISSFNKLNCIANIAYLLHVGSRKILTRLKIRVDRRDDTRHGRQNNRMTIIISEFITIVT